jgi:hypothetical protein
MPLPVGSGMNKLIEDNVLNDLEHAKVSVQNISETKLIFS